MSHEDREDFRVAIDRLTEIERKVLVGLVSGASTGSLAKIHGLAFGAVEQVRADLMEKLSARSTADLVRIGIMTKVRWP